jgi:hypothetical protein
MRCPACGSTTIRQRPERTAQGYRRFRCQCGKQFNERSADVLNKAQYPSDVIALVVLWRLRYKLSLQVRQAKLSSDVCEFVLVHVAPVGGEAPQRTEAPFSEVGSRPRATQGLE